MAVPLSVKGIFKCRPVLVSLAILQVWVKVINEVIVRVVQPVIKKAWTIVYALLWWRHHNLARGGITAEQYLKCLKKHLPPLIVGQGKVFMHNGAPIHKAKIVR